MKTQKQIFFERLAVKRANGLISTHFFATEKIVGATEEEVYGELNRMDDAPDVIDYEIFPNGKMTFGKESA